MEIHEGERRCGPVRERNDAQLVSVVGVDRRDDQLRQAPRDNSERKERLTDLLLHQDQSAVLCCFFENVGLEPAKQGQSALSLASDQATAYLISTPSNPSPPLLPPSPTSYVSNSLPFSLRTNGCSPR